MILTRFRNRKALESRSFVDEEKLTLLESQVNESRYIAEDADHKYDEVIVCHCAHDWLDHVQPTLYEFIRVLINSAMIGLYVTFLKLFHLSLYLRMMFMSVVLTNIV